MFRKTSKKQPPPALILPEPPPPGSDVKELMRYNDACDRLRAEAAKAGKPATSPSPASRPAHPNDVHEMLRVNKLHEAERSINGAVEVPPKRSRRNRDYALLMILANSGMVLLLLVLSQRPSLLFSTRPGIIMLISGVSFMILISAGLTWVMYQVMDDY